jgi:hypothetical protein
MRRVEARSGLARVAALSKATLVAVAVGGCSTAAPPASADAAEVEKPDAAVASTADAAPGTDAAATADAAPPAAYRHTIVVDGSSAFTGDEVFATTTDSYNAYATWDDDQLYLGYLGSDVASNDAHKWLFVYLDVAPGGSPDGERYNTQTPAFPAGFRADYYYRWQASGGVEDVKAWDGEGWQTSSIAPSSARGGPFLEIALPLADLGEPSAIEVALLWINETDGLEAAYGGLYPDSFADGYHASIPVARYLAIDRASSLPPNDAGNRRP